MNIVKLSPGGPDWFEYEYAVPAGVNSAVGADALGGGVEPVKGLVNGALGSTAYQVWLGSRKKDAAGVTLKGVPRLLRVLCAEPLTAEQEAALAAAVGQWDPSPSEAEIDAGTELELSGLQNARRKAFDRMVSKTMRLLLQTGAAANKDEAVTMGRAFMFPHRSARLEWVDTGYDVPVLAAITADTTPWLDFAHGNQSIRDYILSVFEG